MAEIISTVDIGKDYEILSKKIMEGKKNEEDGIKNLDPSKTCMTHTVIPNRRPVEKKDIDKFINRIKTEGKLGKNVEIAFKGKVLKPVKEKNIDNETKIENSANIKDSTEIKTEEKKNRGRPKVQKSVEK